jgi:hypothetical protein
MLPYNLISTPLLKNERENKKNSEVINDFALRTKELSNYQWKIIEYLDNKLTAEVANFLTTDQMHEFEESIIQAAKDLASTERCTHPNWFTQAEEVIVELTRKRNEALKDYITRPTDENHLILTETCPKYLRRNIWQLLFAEQCQNKNFKENHKEAWSMFFEIDGGLSKQS